MRVIRLCIAIAIMRAARVVADAVAGPETGSQSDPVCLRPVERMLLGSIVGMFIAGLWIWISARAGL